MDTMAMINLLCLTILLFRRGIYGDSMEIEDYSQSKAITSCKEGLIANVDNYTITARITADVKTLNFKRIIYIAVYRKQSTSSDMLCVIYFSETCEDVVSYGGCYCKGYKQGTYEVLINEIAQLSESEAAVRLEWSPYASKIGNFTRNVTLPVIYSQDQASLHVGRTQLDLAHCNAQFHVNDVLEWCVYNVLGQTVTIHTDYGSASSEKNCVRHTFRFHQAKSNYFNVSFEEHRGCQRRKTYTCHWQTLAAFQKSTNENIELLINIKDTCSLAAFQKSTNENIELLINIKDTCCCDTNGLSNLMKICFYFMMGKFAISVVMI